MIWFWSVIAAIVYAGIMLFVLAAFALSGRISREEEAQEAKRQSAASAAETSRAKRRVG